MRPAGRPSGVAGPAGARVVPTAGEDCLVYRHAGRTEYQLTPFVVLLAGQGARGLRLIGDEPGAPG
jgi:hypothetical protein